MKSVMSSDEAKAIYGSRLDGMKDVEITNETTDKVEKKIIIRSNFYKCKSCR